MAGTISAVNNNGIGVCGIAGGSGNNDGVKIMSIQIFAGRYQSTISRNVDAIYYATSMGGFYPAVQLGVDEWCDQFG